MIVGSEECDHEEYLDGVCCFECYIVDQCCGDGVYWPTQEECDRGEENSNEPNAICRPDCTLSECPDGIIDDVLHNEECDDGNDVNGDGCSWNCIIEDVSSSWVFDGTAQGGSIDFTIIGVNLSMTTTTGETAVSSCPSGCGDAALHSCPFSRRPRTAAGGPSMPQAAHPAWPRPSSAESPSRQP